LISPFSSTSKAEPILTMRRRARVRVAVMT
jgi:hypothetical protein